MMTTATATATATTSSVKETAAANCAVCGRKIVDGKEDALFCEGSCKQWCHRYCVGVPLERFATLVTSSSPFVCPTCSQSLYEQEVSLLKSTVEQLKEEIQGIRADIHKLKENQQLGDAPTFTLPLESDKVFSSECVCASGVGVGGGGGGGGRGRGSNNNNGDGNKNQMGERGAGGIGAGGNVGTQPKAEGGRNGDSGESNSDSGELITRKALFGKIRMENCKKIWGTLHSTTSAAISNVLKKTTSESLSNCLSVKKKYKLDVNGSIGKWWFVVRGEKSDIESLVEVWDRVSLQTAWRLEDMFSFADDVFLPLSSSPSIPTNVTIVDKGCSSVPTHVTAVVGNGHAVVNNGHMENNGESTSSLCSEQSATITVVEQSLCTSKHAKHASCQSNTSFAIPSSDNSASADMTPSFLKV